MLSFAYHLNNGIPIVPYYDSEEDSELSILGYYLLSIYQYDDLREANKIHIRIDYYLEEAKKDMEEEEDEEEEEEDEEDNSVIEKNESTIISLLEIKTDEKDNELDRKLTLKNVRELENKIESRSNANRTYTLNAKQKINELGGLSPTRRNRRKRTNNNEGLNIFDVWKDIRQEMNEKKKKSRFHQ